MKSIFVVLVFSISLYGFAQDRIFWHSDSLLSWNDFKATPKREVRAAAISYCGMTMNSCYDRRSDTYTYKVETFFDPHKSWVKHYAKDNWVLGHEQLHFDIAELFARKLRKHYATQSVKVDASTRVFQQYYKQYEQFQKAYDYHTSHGMDSLQQYVWRDSIQNQLKVYQAYKENKCY